MRSAKNPLQRVLELIPELPVRSLRTGEDGLVNDVLIINEELVFRFARTEAARQTLEREAQLLALVRPRVSLAVPEVIQLHDDCMVCRFIPGVPLDRERLLAQEGSTREAILEQLGGFLRDLHSVPMGAIGAINPHAQRSPGMKEDYQELYQTLERELFPSMMAWARDWARRLFQPLLEEKLDLSYTPAMIHGDLAPYHLCYDPVTQRLSGVIDFGNAGPGDPALDLGSIIISFGESLLWRMQTVYWGISDLLERARFHAATLELRWALAALRSRDPAWFLCHLGYARDAWPVGWPGKQA